MAAVDEKVVGADKVAEKSDQAGALQFGGKSYGSVEELGKAYEGAQSELGKWTQQHGDLSKQHDDLRKQYDQAQALAGQAAQWTDWWEKIKPYWGQDVQDLIRQKIEGQSTRRESVSAPTNGAELAAKAFEGFDLLRPDEQAMRIKQAVAEELVGPLREWQAQFTKAHNDGLAKREDWYQKYISNYFSLFRKAMDKKIADPSFDIDKTMEQAVKAMGGQLDPFELGQQMLAGADYASALEKARKEAYAQGKLDLEQEIKNKKIETVPVGSSAPPVFRAPVTPPGTRLGLGTLRQRAAESMAQKFGAGLFTGE